MQTYLNYDDISGCGRCARGDGRLDGMRKFRLLAIAIAALLLTGCSTTQTKHEKPIPDERLYMPELLQAGPETEAVKFTRDSGMLGSGCNHAISIDGQSAFDIRAGEAVKVYLEPGEHLFVLETGRGSCPNEVHSDDTTLVLGTPQVWRISVSSNFNLLFTRIQ